MSLVLKLISNFILSLFGENQTLEGHVRTTFDLYGIQDWIPVFWPVHLDFNSTLGGLQAYKYIYYKDGGKYQVMEIGTIANNDIYQINYSSTPGKFSENLLTVQHMINSLKIGRPHSVPDLIKSSEDISFDFKSDPSIVHTVDDIAHEECAGFPLPLLTSSFLLTILSYPCKAVAL
jgi:hypothetical protein